DCGYGSASCASCRQASCAAVAAESGVQKRICGLRICGFCSMRPLSSGNLQLVFTSRDGTLHVRGNVGLAEEPSRIVEDMNNDLKFDVHAQDGKLLRSEYQIGPAARKSFATIAKSSGLSERARTECAHRFQSSST